MNFATILLQFKFDSLPLHDFLLSLQSGTWTKKVAWIRTQFSDDNFWTNQNRGIQKLWTNHLVCCGFEIGRRQPRPPSLTFWNRKSEKLLVFSPAYSRHLYLRIMSGIPTPRSGLARPSRLAPPGTIPSVKRPRTEAEESQPSKKPKPAQMAPPKTAPVRKTTTAGSTLNQRKPLSTRNTLASRNTSALNRTVSSSLNRTVASAQPSQEKPKGTY